MALIHQRRNTVAKLVPFVVGLVVMLCIGWILFPRVLYVEKPQPMNFSHLKHGGQIDLTCDSCHSFRQDGSFKGIPDIATCVPCHENTNSQSPDEALLIADYIEKNREIPWRVYSRQPICVYFAHAPHVLMAKIDCQTCHGPKQEEKVMPVYEQNWITTYSRNIWGNNIAGLKLHSWDRMKMDDCADCHRERNAPNGCFVCHK